MHMIVQVHVCTYMYHSVIPSFPQSSKSYMDPGMGRIIYERSGEFFFIPYAFTDVNDEREIRRGDEVSFYMAKNKRLVNYKWFNMLINYWRALLYDNSCIEQLAIKGMYVCNAALPQTDVHEHDMTAHTE